MSTLPPSTANWHWKNKNVTAWGKSWFERELVTVQIKGDGSEVVSITEVSDVDGDVELGQRKSKLITIYDCKIDLKWSGTASDGTEVNGKLRIPEVSHEITLDGLSDYVYDWKLSTPSTPAVDKLFALAKKKMPEALEAKFSAFPAAITEIHGKDLQVSSNAASAEPSRTGTPAPAPVPTVGSGASSSASAPKAVKQDKPVNTTTVDVEASFMASADDLFEMMTDENKIPMWTRAPAQSRPEPNGSFSLLGGGVKGTYVSLEKPKKIVQKWALSSPTWPTGHAATLTFSFDQSSESTKLTISLDGVPKGMEEEIKRNLEGYYIQGLKSIGLGSVL
ncbi:activator of Hsp90 ATPase [Pyrrhoderma noxium]|uniref:Activator of Hsp90 ATPase n=1 Tax=Pyrrhoderma noxium TaxID=2282107 RepID=A0A286UWI8_9AGAM|nr:activator of Hsp90 ATPase [Pyrrhoderma noxium]